MSDLSKKTVFELKAYAKANEIDLGNARTKAEILAKINGINATVVAVETEEDSVIKSKQKNVSTPTVPSVIQTDGGAIGSRSAEKKSTPVESTKPSTGTNKVAVFAEKNLHWRGVGSVSAGYNIVTKEAAAKWLTQKSVRSATPEEVAAYYGKA